MSEQPKALMALVRELRDIPQFPMACGCGCGEQHPHTCFIQAADLLEAALKTWAERLRRGDWRQEWDDTIAEHVLGVEEQHNGHRRGNDRTGT